MIVITSRCASGRILLTHVPLVLVLGWQVKCAVQMSGTSGCPLASATPAAAGCPTPRGASSCAVRGGCTGAAAGSAAGRGSSARISSAAGDQKTGWPTAAFQVRPSGTSQEPEEMRAERQHLPRLEFIKTPLQPGVSHAHAVALRGDPARR